METIVTRMAARALEVVWAYYEFAFNTGLRTSEQIVLRWGNINWRPPDGEDRQCPTMATFVVRKKHTFS